MDKDLLDILFKHDRSFPLYNFLNEKGELNTTLTVAELTDNLRGFASKLYSFEAGSRALLVFPTCKEFLIAFFGCIYAGIIPVPVSLPSRLNGIRHLDAIIHDCQANIIVFEAESYHRIQAEISDRISNTCDTIVMNENRNSGLKNYPKRRYLDSNIAFLQYTSGSTSSPKGVVVTHRNIVENQQMIHERFQTSCKTVFLGWPPLHHDMGLIGNVMQPMFIGCRCYLIAPVVLLMRPKIWLKVISEYKVTVTGGPNFSYKHVLKRIKKKDLPELKLDFSHLKVLYNGAEPIEVEVMIQFTEMFTEYGFSATTFLPCYGMAEATLLASGTRHNDIFKYKRLCSKSLQLGTVLQIEGKQDSQLLASCGCAVKGVQIRVRDLNNGDVLNANKVGFIELMGSSISPGYWHQYNGQKPYMHFLNGWLNTGDLGFLDDDGELYLCGRQKDVIIIDGCNIYPQDLEKTIENTETTLNIASSAAFSHNSNIYLIVELSRYKLSSLSKKEIKDAKVRITKNINKEFGVGVASINIVRPHTIPKTTSHKIQRQKLKKQYLENTIEEINLNE